MGLYYGKYNTKALFILQLMYSFLHREHAVAQLVEELRYKPEGRGFDPWWCH
jgi:hypothetical protein